MHLSLAIPNAQALLARYPLPEQQVPSLDIGTAWEASPSSVPAEEPSVAPDRVGRSHWQTAPTQPELQDTPWTEAPAPGNTATHNQAYCVLPLPPHD